jgi:hypothetical protein
MTRKFLMLALLATPLAANAQPKHGPAPADAYDGVPPASAYQGGAGSPFSNRASNIEGSGPHAEIAPRLPSPDATGDDAHDLLVAADRALMRKQTGAAQEALERAETRVLTRSTDPALADRPDNNLLAQAISEARRALGKRDVPRARAIIGHVLNPG